MEATRFPPMKWAQRADVVLITIDIADAEQINVDVDEEKQTLNFSCVAGNQKYAMDLQVFEKIVKEESKWNLKGRNVIISLSKEDKEQEEWWPRITKDKVKNQFITIDFARWVDPDDSGDDKKEGPPGGGGDFDPSMMQGMGGGGGMPGMGGGGMPGMGGGAGGMDMASMMAGMGGGGGMPGMGGPGGPGGGMGGMDMAKMMEQMKGMGMGGGAGGPGGGMDMASMMAGMGGGGGMPGMGGGQEGDSDDEDGEEAQVEPHTETKDAGDNTNLDDLDGDATEDLKK